MLLDGTDALRLTNVLIALAVLLQNLELLRLRAVFTENGVWTWSVLQEEFRSIPGPIRLVINILLADFAFPILLGVSAFAAAAALFFQAAWLPWIMLAAALLTSARWRGAFNGGGDYMTIVVLSAVSIAALFPNTPGVLLGCLWYTSLHVCASYLIAGLVKLKNRDWRSGEALSAFIRSTIFLPNPRLERASENGFLMKLASLALILFELSFPLALLGAEFAAGYACLGIIFHLGAFYVFGLNRFVFAWAAGYPALIFCGGVVGF